MDKTRKIKHLTTRNAGSIIKLSTIKVAPNMVLISPADDPDDNNRTDVGEQTSGHIFASTHNAS